MRSLLAIRRAPSRSTPRRARSRWPTRASWTSRPTPVFNLTVTVTDSGGLTDKAAVTVNLTDVNEEPAASDATFALAENSADGTVVGTVSRLRSGRRGQPLLCDHRWRSDGCLRDRRHDRRDHGGGLGSQLDFETIPVFSLTVTVTDAGGLTDDGGGHHQCDGRQRSARRPSDSIFSLAENSGGRQVVGSVSASDPDAGDSLSYAITDGDPTGVFAINATTGEITVADRAAAGLRDDAGLQPDGHCRRTLVA